MAKVRGRKIAGIIKSELGIVIDQRLRDPRKKIITVTDVQLNKDMSLATIYISAFGTDKDRQTALDVVNDAKPFLRSHIAKILRVRKVPELRFLIDNSFEYGSKIDTLLQSIKHKKNNLEE